jgi:uncharacterized RDD family membrane protein YckC
MRTVGIGTRVLNFLVDTAIIFLFTYIAFKSWNFYSFYYHIVYLQFYYFFAVILFFYYLLFESFFGRTPGKLVSLSKVVNKNGVTPSFFQIFLRSVVRLTIIDCFFIPILDKTLHDFLSKTEVVEI